MTAQQLCDHNEPCACHEHSHHRLLDSYQDRVVPAFKHTHEYTDGRGVHLQGVRRHRSHNHLLEEDEHLIPPHILHYWKERFG